MSSRKLLLIGWDAADWSMIHPLMDRGQMPNLQRLVDGGVIGHLSTMDPPISPLLWTSIVTGKTADQHRVLGFVEPDPVSGGSRLTASSTRACKAFWNILNQSGKRPHVVNWFASHPAEPISGVYVSSQVCQGRPELPAGSVHPQELEQTLSALRLTPRDISANDLRLFVPELERVDQEKDKSLLSLARVLCDGLTAHAAATWILQHESWDFLGVYLDTIDHAGHFFMQYHPPRMENIRQEEFEIYQHVMDGVYRMHDLMLGRLLELAGPDATVMIVSDHGFTSGKFRPTADSLIPQENNMLWHRRYGVFCMAGPGIRQDEMLQGAGLLDIAPTMLTLFGLPVGEDMPGRPLLEAFIEPPKVERIPSWETVEGDAGMHPQGTEPDPWDTTGAIEQLAALGYVEDPGPEVSQRLEMAKHHQNLNLARVYVSTGRPAEAIPLLEGILEDLPGQPGLLLYLGQACFRARQPERAEKIAEQLLLVPEMRLISHVLRANSSIYQGKQEEALTHLLKAEEAMPSSPEVMALVGEAYLRLRRSGDAEAAFRRALELDERIPRALRGLAAAMLMQKRYREAADAALDAVGLDYGDSVSHYLLGTALLRIGDMERSIQAFEICLKFNPKFVAAHRWLEAIHAQATKNEERAQFHRTAIEAIRPGRRPSAPASV